MSLSRADRESLARRAVQRRKEVGITRAALSRRIGLNYPVLIQWEMCILKKQKETLEARWELELNVPRGWLRNLSLETPPPLKNYVIDLPCGTTVAQEIFMVAGWLARKHPQKRTIFHSKLTPLELRNAEMFSQRYGQEGEQYSTLESIGLRCNLTRERVRQIVEKMVGRSEGFQFNTPVIDEIRNQINPLLPVSIASLNKKLRSQLGRNLSIVELSRFCNEILGKNMAHITSIRVGSQGAFSTIEWADIDASSDIESELRAVRTNALKMISSVGAAHLETLTGRISKDTDKAISYQRVSILARSIDGFEWLSEDTDWFWFGPLLPRRSRLVNAARKLLSITSEYVDKQTIFNGYLQTRRYLSQKTEKMRTVIEIPMEVMAEVLRRSRQFDVKQYDDFKLIEQINRRSVLSDMELLVLGILDLRGGVASRRRLLKEVCDDHGIAVISLQATLDRSPLFIKYLPGIYGNRCTPLSVEAYASALQDIENQFSSSHELPTHEEKENGDFVFTVNAGVAVVKHKSIIIPAAVARLIDDGQYKVINENRSVTVTTVRTGAMYARLLLANYFGSLELGDKLTIRISPKFKTIEYVVS